MNSRSAKFFIGLSISVSCVFMYAGYCVVVSNQPRNGSLSNNNNESPNQKEPRVVDRHMTNKGGDCISAESSADAQSMQISKFVASYRALMDSRQENKERNDTPQIGMVSPSDAIAKARANFSERNRCRTAIALVDDVYLIEFWEEEHAFRAEKSLRGTVGIDARSGEFIGSYPAQKGGQFYSTDKETRASEERMRRIKPAIIELDKRAAEGLELNSQQVKSMISPQTALELAVANVSGRKFDCQKDPLVILVDNVYMVVFWRPEGSLARYHEKTYDARVAIDAYTGEYIGTETTKNP